jgi:hypothetical protein
MGQTLADHAVTRFKKLGKMKIKIGYILIEIAFPGNPALTPCPGTEGPRGPLRHEDSRGRKKVSFA